MQVETTQKCEALLESVIAPTASFLARTCSRAAQRKHLRGETAAYKAPQPSPPSHSLNVHLICCGGPERHSSEGVEGRGGSVGGLCVFTHMK